MNKLSPFAGQLFRVHRLAFVCMALLGWLLLAATVAPVYVLTLSLGRAVLLLFAGRFTVLLLSGQTRGLLAFLAGLGGALYVLGLVLGGLGVQAAPGLDLGVLLKAVGFAFLVLPFVLGSLPPVVRRSLGLELL